MLAAAVAAACSTYLHWLPCQGSVSRDECWRLWMRVSPSRVRASLSTRSADAPPWVSELRRATVLVGWPGSRSFSDAVAAEGPRLLRSSGLATLVALLELSTMPQPGRRLPAFSLLALRRREREFESRRGQHSITHGRAADMPLFAVANRRLGEAVYPSSRQARHPGVRHVSPRRSGPRAPALEETRRGRRRPRRGPPPESSPTRA